MFLSLVSGSSGNATLISDSKTNILIDCGISGKKLDAALNTLNISGNKISALLLTHEHSDHILGAGVIARKYNIPIYATHGTHSNAQIGKITDEKRMLIKAGEDFEIGNIGIKPFNISHDAIEPVGFNFFIDNKKYTLATDSGEITKEIETAISGSDEIILESNHDTDLLMYGDYPFNLKKRILGKRGHLSNENAAKTAVRLLSSGTKKIMLAHLSPENNTPEIAYQTTKNALISAGAKLDKDIFLTVANRFDITRF